MTPFLRRLVSLLFLLSLLPAAAAAGPADARDYEIAPGDVLRVSVYQNPDLSLEARVNESGSISYPLLGPVRVAGMTVPQIEAELTRGLREGQFVKQPQILVNVAQYRGNQVSALGMVNRPGRYPLDVVGMRLSEVLAQAGGIAAGGADSVVVNGRRNGRPHRLEVEVAALYGRSSRGEDPVLQAGDVVFVDRAPTVYVYGEVQRPGALRLERDMTVLQALAAGGGLTLRGTDKGVRIHRRAAQGEMQVLQPMLADRLMDGDVVQVRESLF